MEYQQKNVELLEDEKHKLSSRNTLVKFTLLVTFLLLCAVTWFFFRSTQPQQYEALKLVAEEVYHDGDKISFLGACGEELVVTGVSSGIPSRYFALVVPDQYVKDKRTVMVKYVHMPKPGFVVIESDGKVVGVSDFVPAQTIVKELSVTLQQDMDNSQIRARIYFDDGDGVFSEVSDIPSMTREKCVFDTRFTVAFPLPEDTVAVEPYLLGERIGSCHLTGIISTSGYQGTYNAYAEASKQIGTIEQLSLGSGRESFVYRGRKAPDSQVVVKLDEKSVLMFVLGCSGNDTAEAKKIFEEVVNSL